MSRKTFIKDKQDTVTYTENHCNNSDDVNLITASNSELFIAPGYSLAIIDEDGKIVRQGSCVRAEVFDAMTRQVIKSFCSKFKGFDEADFKKLA